MLENVVEFKQNEFELDALTLDSNIDFEQTPHIEQLDNIESKSVAHIKNNTILIMELKVVNHSVFVLSYI